MSDTFGKVIMVPIHIDALLTPENLRVAGPTIDFSKTPWDGAEEPAAYLGKTLVREPFSITADDQSATSGETILEAGVHLHWSLPNAFTQNMRLPIVRLETFRGTFGFEYPVVDANGNNPHLVSDGDEVWKALIKIGWLTPLKDIPVLAQVQPKDERQKFSGAIPDVITERRDIIERLLDHSAFPAVPTCWWVNRYDDTDNIDQVTPDQCIQVISDLVQSHSTEGASQTNPTTLPIDQGLFEPRFSVAKTLNGKGESVPKLQLSANPPYQRVGMTFKGFPLGDGVWDPDEDYDYLVNPLTALGGGDPTFAAFYPNCRSVFGCYDNGLEAQDSLTYEVFGWYRETQQDYFRFFVQSFLKKQTTPNGLALLQAIKESFGWWLPLALDKAAFTQSVWQSISNKVGLDQDKTADSIWAAMASKKWITISSKTDQKATLAKGAVNDDLNSHLGPSFAYAQSAIEKVLSDHILESIGDIDQLRLLCYGRVTLADTSKIVSSSYQMPDIESVTIGNSGTEALSTYLANQLANQYKQQTEDYLEAIQFFEAKGNRQLDIGAKFLEYRHTKGFTAESAGTLWTIRAINATNTKADSSQQSTEQTLPDSLAARLNSLNILQAKVDHLSASLDDTRAQLFADWCKYLELTYYEESSPPANPDVVRSNYIEDNWQQKLKDFENKLVSSQQLLIKMRKELTQALINLQLISGDQVQDWAMLKVQLLKYKENDLIQDLTGQLEQGFDDHERIIKMLNSFLVLPSMYQHIFPLELPKTTQDLIRKDATQWSRDEAKQFSTSAKDYLPQEAIALLVNAKQNWDLPLQMRYNRLVLQTLFPALTKQAWLVLQPKAAPRFWTPNEPSLLLTGPAATEATRFRSSGQVQANQLLDVYSIELEEAWHNVPRSISQFQAVKQYAQSLAAQEPDNIAFHTETSNPWQPFFLEWEVDVFAPDKEGPQHQFGDLHQYSEAYLIDKSNSTLGRYQLPENKCELQSTKALKINMSANSSFRGYSIITPHASIQLKQKIRAYLIELLEAYDLSTLYKAHNVSETNQSASYIIDQAKDLNLSEWLIRQSNFAHIKSMIGKNAPTSWLQQKDNIDQLIKWGTGQSTSPQEKLAFDLLLSLVAYEKALATNCLSQSLSGFNAAMLTLQQMYQLPVLDLVEEDVDFFPFSNKMRQIIQGQNRLSPRPLNPFMPVRAGQMNISKLNILDNFGRRSSLTYEVGQKEPAPILSSEPLASNGQAHCTLPPRFVPPTRLNFRWLSAADEQVEMNDHPATTPICGWVLPNFLDNSLMIYEQSGNPLGYIDQAGNWRLFPGHLGPALPEAIENDYLRRMVRWFCSKALTDNSYMDELIQDLKLALDNIEPESTPQHQGLSLLIGRPLALVRANLSMEGKGEPAYSQNWAYVKTYPGNQQPDPTTYRYEEVEIPVRIGERSQFNDGLVLCWEEDTNADDLQPHTYYVNNDYYASQSKSTIGTPLFYLNASAKNPRQYTLSMLVDPKGEVHATSGVLPTKSIHIPSDQFAKTLQQLEVVFFTGPLLTDEERINIGTPIEAGYHWAWTDKQAQGWRTVSKVGHIEKKSLAQHFPSRVEHIWSLLLQYNWIIPSSTRTDAATVTPTDQRHPFPKPEAEALADLLPQLEDLIGQSYINPFHETAKFSGRQEIREGWLRLQPDPPTNTT